MSTVINNALASLAVKDLDVAAAWYGELIGRQGAAPMPEVREWSFPRGGALQLYQDFDRAGQGSCTLAVDDVDAQVAKLESMGVDASQRTSGPRVKTVMITDPDGNHLAFAQAMDASLAR